MRPVNRNDGAAVTSKASKHRSATAARVAQLRREQAARERRNRLLIWSAVAVLVLAAVAAGALGVAFSRHGDSSADAAINGVRSFTEDRGHVTTPVRYPQTPPAGGPHNPVWLNCGVYASPVPNENAVHDLEHGAVWITYRPDLPAAQLATLKQLVGAQTYLDLTPYPGLPAPVVASAWGKQLRADGASDPRLARFVAAYRLNPAAPEPGAPCTGGTGTPNGT